MNMSKNVIRNHAVNYLPKNTYITCKSDNKYMYILNEISPPRLTMLPSPKSHRLPNKKPTPGIKSPLLVVRAVQETPKKVTGYCCCFWFPPRGEVT